VSVSRSRSWCFWLGRCTQSLNNLLHIGIAIGRGLLHEPVDHCGQSFWHSRIEVPYRIGLLGSVGLELLRCRTFKREPARQAIIEDATEAVLISGGSALRGVEDALRTDTIQSRGEHVGSGPSIHQRFLLALSQQGTDSEIENVNLLVRG